MKTQIVFSKTKDSSGHSLMKLRGGRLSLRFKDKKQYTRKQKHKQEY